MLKGSSSGFRQFCLTFFGKQTEVSSDHRLGLFSTSQPEGTDLGSLGSLGSGKTMPGPSTPTLALQQGALPKPVCLEPMAMAVFSAEAMTPAEASCSNLDGFVVSVPRDKV